MIVASNNTKDNGNETLARAVDHHRVEAVVRKEQQAAKQLSERLHRPSPGTLALDNKIIRRTTGGVKCQISLSSVFSRN